MGSKIRSQDRECPLSSTAGYIGEWWTLLILHDAFDGYSRFEQFQDNLDISTSMLSVRLKKLVADGLMERQQYETRPPRFEYVLTDLGRSLRPILVAMAAWGNERLEPEKRAMILIDTATEQEVEAVVVDRATGRDLRGESFRFTAGPAASPLMRARYAKDRGKSDTARPESEQRAGA